MAHFEPLIESWCLASAPGAPLAIPRSVVQRASEPWTTLVGWTLTDGPFSVAASVRTEGVGAVSDGEMVAAVMARGAAAALPSRELVATVDGCAKRVGVDFTFVELFGSVRDLRAFLLPLERMLFSQERRCALLVRGGSPHLAAAKPVVRQHRRSYDLDLASKTDPRSLQDCQNVLWRLRGEEVHLVHRCTHEKFGVALAGRSPLACIREAAELLGLRHPVGADYIRLRRAEALAWARKHVPAFAGRTSFERLPVATPDAWVRRFWPTTSLRGKARSLVGRDDLVIKGSSGTTSGTRRLHIVERDVAEERYGAEIALWGRVRPWRLAIVNRPSNLFAAHATDDRYRSRKNSRDLRVTPGLNPTTARPQRYEWAAAAIAAHRPTALAGDAQYLVGLLPYLDCARVPGLREVAFSNHASWSFQRRDVAAHFGVPARSLYHCGETSMIALSCRHGRWHLLESYANYEVFAGGQAVALGTPGLLVATTFDTQVRPLLRYALGDVVRIEAPGCPCGNPARVVILEGRAAFSFRDGRGLWTTPRMMDQRLRSARGVRFLQVAREERAVRLRFVGDADARIPRDELEENLALPVHLERVESLPLASEGGKLSLFSVPGAQALREEHFLSKKLHIRFADSLNGE